MLTYLKPIDSSPLSFKIRILDIEIPFSLKKHCTVLSLQNAMYKVQGTP